MIREPYRLFRLDRDDVFLPLLKDLSALIRERAVAGREHGYNSPQFNDACERLRERLYNEQETIVEALQFKDTYVHVDDLEQRVAAEVEKEISRRRAASTYAQEELTRLQEFVRSFEQASGLSLSRYSGGDPTKLGVAVKAVLSAGPEATLAQVNRVVAHGMKVLGVVQDQIADAVRSIRGEAAPSTEVQP